MGQEEFSAWQRMLGQLPTALDPMEARAVRGNDVLAPPSNVPAQPPSDGTVESSLSPRQQAAQQAFDAHMAEQRRLQILQGLVAPELAPPPASPDEPFDPSSYTTYKRP